MVILNGLQRFKLQENFKRSLLLIWSGKLQVAQKSILNLARIELTGCSSATNNHKSSIMPFVSNHLKLLARLQ